MRTRTSLLLLIITTMLLGSIGSVMAVATTTGTAHACSIAPPWAEITPSTNLEPGQQIQISGYGFSDLIWHDEQPMPQPAPGQPEPPRIAQCDFDAIPMQNIEIVWYGDTVEKLGVVQGPEFTLSTQVPANASSGEAWIAVGVHEFAVQVGPIVTPPPHPCPLVAGPDGTATHDCPPEPWPCPLYGAAQTQPAPDVDFAPGFLPPCPEPCVDYAQTTGDGTTYDYQWDCPDPCSFRQADPGAPNETSAVWCPPEPCNWVGGDALVCPEPCPLNANTAAQGFAPCPDPCGLYPNAPIDELNKCPEPCRLVGGDAFVCPEPCLAVGGPADDLVNCPFPCPLYPAADEALLPCPDPCWNYLADSPDIESQLGYPCPEPCNWVGGDALVCPEPCPVYAHLDATQPAPEPVDPMLPTYCPDPCGSDIEGAAVWCPPKPPWNETSSTAAEPVAAVEVDEPATADASTETGVVSAPVVAPAAVAPSVESAPAQPAPAPTEAQVQAQAAPATRAAAAEPATTLVEPTNVVAAPVAVEPDPSEPLVPSEHLPEVLSQRVTQSASAIFAAIFG